jgi:hypothetical protein
MANTPEMTPHEAASALNILMRRMADAKWADTFSVSEGKYDIGFTDLGQKRMQMLYRLFYEELKPMPDEQLLVLLSLLACVHSKKQAKKRDPES